MDEATQARIQALERGEGALCEAGTLELDDLLGGLHDSGEGDAYSRLVLAVRTRHPEWAPAERVKRYDRALRLASDPTLRDHLRLMLADQHSITGDVAAAARWLDDLDPEHLSPAATNAYALQLRRLGRLVEAEAAWLRLVARNDDVPEGLLRYGWSHIAHLRMTAGRLDEVQGALDAAEAVQGADAHESTLHLLSTRFDFALRMRDLKAAQDALDAMPSVSDPEHVEAIRVNAACVAALRGEWDAALFRQALSSTRADVRLVAATGLMGASEDDSEARDALLAAEHAHAAAPVVGPEIAWLAEVVADAWEAAGKPDRDVARARRWAARANQELDPSRAARQRVRLVSMGVALLGPFQIGASLGHGGAGTVFRGTHIGGLNAAVKVLRSPHPAGEALLENELRSVAGLDHPCIARLVDTGIIDEAEAVSHPELNAGSRWVATELIEGGELTRLCGHVPWERACSLTLALLDALAHAHARGLLHLDIKPANILLHPSGLPVLVDFGLARAIGTDGPDYLAGTPPFMAPELFDLPWEGVGPSTDVFAAACTLYMLLCGHTPFSGSVFDVRRSHLRGAPALVPTVAVPDGLQGWMDTALAIDVNDRFQSAAAAARALAQVGGVAWEGVPSRPRDDMGSATTALFAHRRPPIVGRAREQCLLAAALTAAQAMEHRAVALVGPEGSGRRALARWVAERAHATGSSAEVTVHHEPQAPVHAGAGQLRVVTAEAWTGDEQIALEPLDDAALHVLLDQSLRLEPPLAQQVVALAHGLPGRLLGILRELVALDRVVAGPQGLHLRPLARLPEPTSATRRLND